MGYSLWLHGFSFTGTHTHIYILCIAFVLTSHYHTYSEKGTGTVHISLFRSFSDCSDCCFATIYLISRMCWGISPNTKSNLNCFVPVERKRIRERETDTHTHIFLAVSDVFKSHGIRTNNCVKFNIKSTEPTSLSSLSHISTKRKRYLF